MNTEIKLIASGLTAALIVSLLGLVAIAIFGTTPLAAEIAGNLKLIASVLTGGLVIDLGFIARPKKPAE